MLPMMKRKDTSKLLAEEGGGTSRVANFGAVLI